jgi:hypothetical protein
LYLVQVLAEEAFDMITLAAVLQLVMALAFVSIPLIRQRFGSLASRHTEAELVRQGVSASALKDNGFDLDASGHETWAPSSIAAVIAALAVLNLSGSELGPVLTLVLQPLVLLGNLAILYSQLTAEKSVRAAFARKGDPELGRVDVRALLDAADKGFPDWVPMFANVRHAVVLVGSALVIGLVLVA